MAFDPASSSARFAVVPGFATARERGEESNEDLI